MAVLVGIDFCTVEVLTWRGLATMMFFSTSSEDAAVFATGVSVHGMIRSLSASMVLCSAGCKKGTEACVAACAHVVCNRSFTTLPLTSVRRKCRP